MSIVAYESFSSICVADERIRDVCQVFFCVFDRLCVSHNISTFLVCDTSWNIHLSDRRFRRSSESFNEHVLSLFKCVVYVDQTRRCFESVIFKKIEFAEVEERSFEIFESQKWTFLQQFYCFLFFHIFSLNKISRASDSSSVNHSTLFAFIL